ncbi:CoA transferase [Salinadaptatus halalkaliphilus]|uniref:CoA transferase n=1 Tax=Salinadaptatus halalkaliphilus TaxID=2419781 RepID=A0A4V3VLF9_9EURY|nr:CoA transferase [Salinadaptatus halalkaliphilus]THE65497.1 CoA transferase [Salinadaptatus halalkaliphilus]
MNALDDVDILDFSQVIAGPACTQFLSSLGATVVKVEPPGGDPVRSIADGTMYAAFNAGKQSVSLDLKTEEGAEIARELASKADVVLESFRPGVSERFDLDDESVRETNEDVVYCSISGFGQSGPYSDRPAYDPIVQAMSGIMHCTGYPDRPPVRVGTSVIDRGTGIYAASLILAALRQRDRTGAGEYIDVSLFDVAFSWMSPFVAQYSQQDTVPQRAGSGYEGTAPNELYYAGDGQPVQLHGGLMFERFCRAIDREDLADDDRFETIDDRWEHREALREELEATFETDDRDELLARLHSHDIPAGPVRDIGEVVDHDPHVRDREMLTETDNPIAETTIQTATLPYRTTDGRPTFDDEPPAVGEQTADILVDLGYEQERIEKLIERGVLPDR